MSPPNSRISNRLTFDSQCEMNLPDENRSFVLSPKIPGCNCGHQAALERRVNTDGKQEFRVLCSVIAAKCDLVNIIGGVFMTVHSQETPWLETSADAIAVWKMVRLLMQ